MTGTDPIDDLLRRAADRRPPPPATPGGERIGFDLSHRRHRQRRARLATGLAALLVVLGVAALAAGGGGAGPVGPSDELADQVPSTDPPPTTTPATPPTTPCPPDPPEPCTSQSGAHGTIVRVVDEVGEPVPGATVEVRTDARHLELATAEEGTAVLPADLVGPGRVTATAPGPPTAGCDVAPSGEAQLPATPSEELVTVELVDCG
ncbi:MAG: carboxypeptidase regulatory-like domain-containing protein [Acidimicrobiales bacterium]|nr:carboxypeptidase regulatory-like domain-containing protein [Acidimicrobiales bacterium]